MGDIFYFDDSAPAEFECNRIRVFAPDSKRVRAYLELLVEICSVRDGGKTQLNKYIGTGQRGSHWRPRARSLGDTQIGSCPPENNAEGYANEI